MKTKMKNIAITAVLLTGLASSVSVFAQGTVLIENSTGGLIYVGTNNATLLAVDVNVSLSGGASAASMAPLASIVGAATAGITLDFGRILDPSGLSRVVTTSTGLAGGPATLQLQLWLGSANSYAEALAAGAAVADSGAFTQNTGGAGSPPGAPAGLTGLPEIHLVSAVPEPSTIALAGIGAAALLMYRRRNA